MTKIVLRSGHGETPPGALAHQRYYRDNTNLPDRAFPAWRLQRPGNKEDLFTARFCAEALIPALVSAGHCVYPQRALDPVHGHLDTSLVTIGPETFPQLMESQRRTLERWRVNASVEAVLRGVARPDWQRGYGWSHDPVISCWAERQAPGDLYLSIHQNWYSSPKMYGCVVLHCPGSRRGALAAHAIYNSIVEAFRTDEWAAGALHPWGSEERTSYIAKGSRWMCNPYGLYELRRTKAPAVLIELGFESNEGDRARMDNQVWRGRMAEAIASGISQAS